MLKRILRQLALPVFMVAALVTGTVAVAQLAVTSANVTAITPTADLVPVVPGGIPSSSGKWATARTLTQVGPGLYTTTATSATGAGTTEQTLATYSLPANWLAYNGRRLKLQAFFFAAANGNNKTFKCYIGASVISSAVLTTNNKNGYCEMDMVRTGVDTQIVTGKMLVDTTEITPYYNAATEDDGAAIVVKFTGTDGTDSAGDIVLRDFIVTAVN